MTNKVGDEQQQERLEPVEALLSMLVELEKKKMWAFLAYKSFQKKKCLLSLQKKAKKQQF
jgi:hypothetical protein